MSDSLEPLNPHIRNPSDTGPRFADPKIDELLIDTALESYPLEDVPAGFTSRVMAALAARPEAAHQSTHTLKVPVEQDQNRPVFQPVPFQLDFLDLVLPMFFALFGAILLAGVATLVTLLDPVQVKELQLITRSLFLQVSTFQGSLLLAASVFALCLGMLVLAITFWLLTPRRIFSRVG